MYTFLYDHLVESPTFNKAVLLIYDQDVERLRQNLERYKKEQEQLRRTKARLLIIEERLRDMHWEDEVRAWLLTFNRSKAFEMTVQALA